MLPFRKSNIAAICFAHHTLIGFINHAINVNRISFTNTVEKSRHVLCLQFCKYFQLKKHYKISRIDFHYRLSLGTINKSDAYDAPD
jgi:hypothetical protein